MSYSGNYLEFQNKNNLVSALTCIYRVVTFCVVIDNKIINKKERTTINANIHEVCEMSIKSIQEARHK